MLIMSERDLKKMVTMLNLRPGSNKFKTCQDISEALKEFANNHHSFKYSTSEATQAQPETWQCSGCKRKKTMHSKTSNKTATLVSKTIHREVEVTALET